MPYNPMEGFKIGQELGKSKKTTFGHGTDQVMGVFDKQLESNILMNKLIGVEKAKSKISSPKEDAQTDFYKASTRALQGGGEAGSSDVNSISSQSGYDPEDYLMQPTVSHYKGQTKVVNTPALKPAVDSKGVNQINDLRNLHRTLSSNLKMITPEIKDYMNPLDPRAGKSGFGSFILKLQSGDDKTARDFMTFKAETDKVFQQYRKDTTGAQAALKELGWLAPDYPESNDPPDTYINKANESLKRIEGGEKLLLDTFSQRGYRVGDLKKGSLGGNVLQQAAAGRADTATDASRSPGGDTESIKQRLRDRYYKGANA